MPKSKETKDMNEMKIVLEEYIPLKVLYPREQEPIDYVLYSKDTKTLLEFAVGLCSRKMYSMKLLLCNDYIEQNTKLLIENASEGNVELDNGNDNCSQFKSIIYNNGVKIIISDKSSNRYIKMGELYFGISSENDITEINVCNMKLSEIQHLKKELEFNSIGL